MAHRGASKWAAVAFYTLFSLPPILVLAISLAGYFFGEEAAQGKIVMQMQALMGLNSGQVINALLASAHNPESSVMASSIATLLLLISTARAFVELKESLDEIWACRKLENNFYQQDITNSAFMLCSLVASARYTPLHPK